MAAAVNIGIGGTALDAEVSKNIVFIKMISSENKNKS
jgi:hypothetical protein